MYTFSSDKKRLQQIDTSELNFGDTIIFCPSCDFQVSNAGLKPHCPQCGNRLNVVTYVEEWNDKIKE